MGGYIFHFMIYTLAMSGLIFFALFIYKKVMSGGFVSHGATQLSIEETLPVNPRKNLMIIRAGEERFLVASDVDKTTLISKLESTNKPKLKSVPIKEESEIEQHKEPVKLEVITQKNPQGRSLNNQYSYTSKNYAKGKTVDIEVGKLQNHGLSTIRELATKINEM